MKHVIKLSICCIALLPFILSSCVGLEPRSADTPGLKKWLLYNCRYEQYAETLWTDFESKIYSGEIVVDKLEVGDEIDWFSRAALYYFSQTVLDSDFGKSPKEWAMNCRNDLVTRSEAYLTGEWKNVIKGVETWKCHPSSDDFDLISELFYRGNLETTEELDEMLAMSILDGCLENQWYQVSSDGWYIDLDDLDYYIQISEYLRCVRLYDDVEKAIEVFRGLAMAYIDYIDKFVEENVKVLNWDYNRRAVADTYTGYLVEYEVTSGYYVLLSLIEDDEEENPTSRWEVIYQGDSLFDMQSCYE